MFFFLKMGHPSNESVWFPFAHHPQKSPSCWTHPLLYHESHFSASFMCVPFVQCVYAYIHRYSDLQCRFLKGIEHQD